MGGFFPPFFAWQRQDLAYPSRNNSKVTGIILQEYWNKRGERMVKPTVVFKGTRDGLVIVLDEETDFSQILGCLEERLDTARDFLQGARVTVELGERKLTLVEAKKLVGMLRNRRGLQVIGFQRGKQRVRTLDGVIEGKSVLNGDREKNREPVEETGDRVDKVLSTDSSTQNRQNTEREGNTLFIRRTLRSGQSVNYHGHVVIIGDVNPGAEVIAGGDIIVLGALRGMAHAGGAGDNTAIITALRLQPIQLRIADVFTRPPDDDQSLPAVPEVALLRDGTIVIDHYLTLGERLRSVTEGLIEEEKEEWRWAK
jgi:septum site-determining protein MinC